MGGAFDVAAAAFYRGAVMRMPDCFLFTTLRAAAASAFLAVSVTGGVGVLDARNQAAAQAAPEKAPATPAEVKKQQEELLNSLFQRLGDADNESAAQLLETAVWQVWLRSGSDTVDLLMQQSIKAMNDSKPATAMAILDAIVELAPNYAEGWNKRATVLFTQGHLDASLRDIDKTLDLEPRHFGALSGLGLIKRAKGDDKAALAAYRRALHIHPFLTGARQAVKELKVNVEGKGI